jgi:hypothetical protein
MFAPGDIGMSVTMTNMVYLLNTKHREKKKTHEKFFPKIFNRFPI